jgi:hypothetical protein
MRVVVTEKIYKIHSNLEEIPGDRRRTFRHNIFTIDQMNTWHPSNTRKKIGVKCEKFLSYIQTFCDALRRQIVNIFFVCNATTNLVTLNLCCSIHMACFVTYVLL